MKEVELAVELDVSSVALLVSLKVAVMDSMLADERVLSSAASTDQQWVDKKVVSRVVDLVVLMVGWMASLMVVLLAVT